MKRFITTLAYLLSIHAMGLVALSLFRITEYICLNGMISNPEADVLPAFLCGLWFDNVVACYVMIVPLAVVLTAACAGQYNRWWRKGAAIWLTAMYVIMFAVSASNIPYFQYFFKNINSSIFGWFGYTATTAGMVFEEGSFWLYILLFAVVSAAFATGVNVLHKSFDKKIEGAKKDFRHPVIIAGKVVVTACVTALCLFGIRGRIGYNPIKISQAYYCDDSFLNQLGINSAFNLLTSALDDMRKENKELRLMPYPKAISYAKESLRISGKIDSAHVLRRYVKADTTMRKHNVVIILMESMSSAFMQTFGQKESLTPTLDSLYNNSLAFTNFYSAGIHTNHGITASLYSFPALMFRNLMKGTVTPKRSGIPTVLKQKGYRNMFFMTHEAQYDNMNAFLRTNGYDEIYSQEDYPKSERVNAFGVSDSFLFNYSLPVIDRAAKSGKPFLATLLTISNHPPYVIPSSFHPKTKEPETQIVEYADNAIADFLKKARRCAWYDNTIFVILADHGKIVGKIDGELPQSYNHIPLIMFGAGVPSMRYEGLGMQVDVMPTLFGLMGMSYEYDGFGVDLLRERRSMVFYSADNQIVARDEKGCYIYNPSMQKSFCYDAKPGWKLSKSNAVNKFSRLKEYVFSMIQTAEFMIRKQQ